MDNKLSELSKPVAWPNGCNETAVEGLRYLAEKPRPSYGNSPFNTEHLYMIASEIKRMADQPLYSQEYVSALLADNERLASDLVARNGEIEGLRERAAELEANLATPVPVPSFDCYKPDVARELQEGFKNTVRAAGFTVSEE